MSQPPRGTVTFLFTDIEGSTILWQQHPHTMEAALKRHHAILSACIADHGGYVFQVIGDAFCAAFSTANDGLEAAIDAQRCLAAENWGEIGPIRVRMALHTGKADLQAGDYTSGEYLSGLTLSRTARLLSAGHGGQILLSLATTELVRDHLPEETTLRDLGPRRLKDLIRPEQIIQVVTPELPSEFAPLKTLDVHPHNLPVQLTSFIGREHEMAEVKKLLSTTHLLTHTGIGGTGKTRLALQVAADLIDDFPDGIWLVELAPVPSPDLVEQTVATALGVHLQPGTSLADQLVDYLRGRQLLLILDNCEHLVEACAYLADTLLRNCPQLKILATSRVHLNISGETTYQVPPLSLPSPEKVESPRVLSQFEAVRLFIERACAVKPGFEVTNDNAPAVAQVCTHLDGIPLAIELAAGRIRHLSPDQISSRLDDRFNLLTGGSRAALPRQQTLRAALDWSYDLLSMAEHTLFNRLAVFTGSFSLEAVEAICAGEIGDEASNHGISPSHALDVLGALVDHSLVSLQERNGENRYILLETVRQYALEKLQGCGELPSLQDRHLAYYLKLAQEGEPHSYVGRPTWMHRFELEYDNFRAAMDYALVSNTGSAILMQKSIGMFIDLSYRVRESYGWALRTLSLTEILPPGKLRAMALWLAGDRAQMLGNYQKAQDLLGASLEMARQLDDKNQIIYSLTSLAILYMSQGNWAQAADCAEQNLTISRELGDKMNIQGALYQLGESFLNRGDRQAGRMYLEQALEMARQENYPNGIAFALESLAQIAFQEGDNSKAKGYYTECAQIRREMGFRSGQAWALYHLGQIMLVEGDTAQARALFEEMHSIYGELKSVGGRGLYPLAMAGVAAQSGHDERALQLFGAAEADAERTDSVMSDVSHQVFDPLIACIRERLGETEFKRLWAEGRKLTLEQALELAKHMEENG